MNRQYQMVIGIALCFVLLFSGCTQKGNVSNQGAENYSGKVITDMAGRKVELNTTVERAIVLTAADGEIVYAIGAGEKLIGRGEFCDYPLEITALPVLQSGQNTNVEQVLAANPDVVIMSLMDQSKDQIEALESYGIPVIVTNAQNIEGLYTTISLLGDVFSQEDEASQLIASMKEKFSSIAQRVAGQDLGTNNKIYFEVSPLAFDLWAAGNDTFMQEIAELLQLENIFSDVKGWGKVSQEQIIQRNPDYIVTVTMYFGEGPDPITELSTRDGWSDITGVKKNQIFHAASDEITRPGPRLADAAEILYGQVYGE